MMKQLVYGYFAQKSKVLDGPPIPSPQGPRPLAMCLILLSRDPCTHALWRPGARFTNIVDRQTYSPKFYPQIGERGENFFLLFQVSLVLSETQRSGSLAKLAMVMAKVGDIGEN